jgi:hypothetical protein
MALVGLLFESFGVRLAGALIVIFGLPAYVARFVLRYSRSTLAKPGALAMVADTYALILLSMALALLAADPWTRPMLLREGDAYARAGSHAMSRVVYFVAGVTPSFPVLRVTQVRK